MPRGLGRRGEARPHQASTPTFRGVTRAYSVGGAPRTEVHSAGGGRACKWVGMERPCHCCRRQWRLAMWVSLGGQWPAARSARQGNSAKVPGDR